MGTIAHGTATTIPQLLADAERRHPDRTLLRFEGQAWSYAAFARAVRDTAGALEAWGLRPADRVALYLDNTPGFLLAYLAVLWSGGVVVPLNARYREGELRPMLRDAEPCLLVTDAAGADVAASLQRDVPSLAAIVEIVGDPSMDVARWRDLARAEGAPEPRVASPDELALIAFTSGTTGRSKGAMLSHGNLTSNARAVSEAWRWTAADHLLLALPLFHIHGLGVGFHGTLTRGASLTLHRRFDPVAVLADLERCDVTMFFGVPTMYQRLLAEAGDRSVRVASLRLLVSGSAPLAATTLERVERVFGHRILERYGMTETVMNLGNPFDGPRKAGSVGMPFAGVEVRLVDPASGRPVRTREAGELHVRGPNVTRGYWRDDEATRAAFAADGWFKTGDLGFVDDDGYVTLTGRARELIISGGFNVYPREVEDLIAALPGVREVAVVGVPDADLGERVTAAVVAEGVDAQAIVAQCRRHLAGFKAPREVVFLDALPRNAMGKILRHELVQAIAARA